MADSFSLEAYYDAYPRLEADFQRALDISLEPRGPELLFDLVSGLDLPPGASVIDVGCGEGRQALTLAERFAFRVTGFDPVPRHLALANERLVSVAARVAGLGDRVRFALGAAEALPIEGGTVDLVWCRDTLVHVAALDRAYAEFRRVLAAEGRVLVYQSCFTTGALDPRGSEWLLRTLGVVPANADPERTEAAIAAAGLLVDQRLDVGLEWAESSEERAGTGTRRLLHVARLLRAPRRYIEQFGQAAYEIMLADCLWHIYHGIGTLRARVYVLSRG